MRLGRFETRGFAETCRTAYGTGRFLALPSRRLPRMPRAERHRAEREWADKVLRFLRVELEVAGVEHIERDQPHIVAPLHESFADCPALLHLPLDLTWVARAELGDWPALGRYLAGTDQIVVPRRASTTSIATLRREAEAVIDRGESLVVFPQGSILGIEVAFQRGAFWLADTLGVPLLPVAIAGTHRVWEHPFRPTLRFGQPVRLEVLSPLAVGTAVDNCSQIERDVKKAALDAPPPVRRFRPEIDGFWDAYPYEIDPSFPDLFRQVNEHRAGSMIP